ncbi:MAG: C39 family peptidase [Candidatus Terrybacteria bacterium]|nr:C39 family peptidase [Candidatus Terrybacteria bacterium]
MPAIPRLVLPAYSQYLDVASRRWRLNACGVVALKTVMDYWLGREVGTFSGIIRQGVQLHAYAAKRGGWLHKGLVALAKRNGFRAYAVDDASSSLSVAIRGLKRELAHGPVLVSVQKYFSSNAGGHLIVVSAFQKSRFFYNEPASFTRKGVRRSVGVKRFARGWKKRYIIVRPAKRIPQR